MDNIEQGFLLLGSNNTNSGVVGSLSHSTKSGRLKRGKSASGRASSFNRPSSAAPTITSFPLSRKKVTSDDLHFLASPGAGDNLTPTKTSFPSSKYKVTSDDLRFLASPGAGDNLTIKDANLRRSLLETFISSEVNAISTRVDKVVHSFNSNHPLVIIENSGNGVASAVPHVSVVEVRSALEEVFRIIDDGIGDRNRVLFELQSGIGSIVSRIVLEDRAKTLQTANRRKASSKTLSRRGSVSTIDDKIENRLQHVDEIIDRCYQTFTERQQKKGPSKEDIVALDSLIKEANDNIARDQLLGENSLNDEMEDDPGAPAFVLKSAMSGAALKDLITKSTKSTESIRIQLLSIFTTVTDLLRGNETAHAKILNELSLKLSMAESELVLLQKSLSESVDAIKDNEASLNSLINQLRLKDLALEKCTAQLQDSQRIVKKLEAENEFRKSVTEKHQSTTTQAPLQNDLNANLESKRAQETASRASIDAKASADKIASQNQMQISDLQKRLSEAEARERALQSKLQSTTDALNKTKVEFAARISAITTTSTSTTSSSTAAAAATVSANAPPQISSIDNSNVNKTDVDKEVKDLQSQVAMLKDKIRELEMKVRESDEERKSLKSSILSANSSQSLPISATDAAAATLSSSSSSSSTTAATVDKLSQQSSTVPENIKSDSTLISKALFEQEMLSAKRDADSSRKLTLELNSEIDRLRQQLLNAKRDSDSKKSSPVNDSQIKTKSSSAATQTDTDVDDHHVSDGNVHNPESPPLLKTPHNTRKSSPLSSPFHHDVHLSLKPIHRITEGVDRGVNASYSVVGASEDVDDTSLISTHRTERSTDQRVQYAPKGGSPSESPEHSGNISNGRPFSPSSASTALRDGSKTNVEEANRFKGASQSVPLQKSPEVLASEALSPENLQGLKDAIEILGRHLFVIRRFGGKTGSAYWTNESAPTLTFTDLISRIEDLHVRVSHPLQNLHTVFKSASDAHHGTSWMRSNAIRTSPIPDSMTFKAVEEPLTQSSPSTASLGSKSTTVPFAILQQALFTPSKQRSSLPRLMSNIPKTLNGKIVLQVYTLDNSYKTLLIEPNSTAHDVCRSMAEKIGFSDPEDDALCFSLNECTDGATIQRAISPEREILSIMETWFDKPGARFIFQIKLYTATLTNSTDPKVIHMMFIQAVYNVITGIYPSNEKEAVSLAALQFQAKFGLHNSASHKPGFLKNLISEFVPAAHMDSEPKQTIETWEQKIFYKHAFSTTTTPREGYLDLLKKRDYYGAVFFAVKQRFSRNIPKRIYMTISRKGIMLFKVPVKVTDSDFEKIGSYNLADIYRWAYKPNVNFYFEVKDEGAATNPIFTFDTQEGKHMSDMLTDYAMALLREMGLNPDGTRRNKPKSKAEIEAAAANAAVTAASASVDGSEGKAAWGEGIDAASAEGAAAEVIPTKSAMATNEEAYAEVGGEVAALATAAVRSGEYTETLPPGSPAQAGQPPPPPLSLSEEGGAQEASSSLSATEAIQATTAETAEVALPAGWIKVTDEASGQPYFFNEGTGVSVWDPKECT